MNRSKTWKAIEAKTSSAGQGHLDRAVSNRRRRSGCPAIHSPEAATATRPALPLLTFALAALLLRAAAIPAQCSEVDPKPTGANLSGLAASNLQRVAVAPGSVILRSSDGTTWGRVENQSDVNYTSGFSYGPDIAFGSGTFVRVDATARISTSPDGVAWTESDVPGAGSLEHVTFGGGTFVASGDPGGVWLSTNGVDWTWQTLNSGSTSFGRARFAGGRFFLLGSSISTADSRTSTDGVQWNGVSLQATGAQSLCPRDVTFASGTYYLVGVNCEGQASSPAYIWTSTDGLNFQWTGASYADDIAAIGTDGTNVVAMGTSLLLTRAGAGPWVSTPINVFAGELPLSILWAGAAYSAVGTGGLLGRSVDGASWQSLQSRFTPGRFDGSAAAANGRVLALAGAYLGLQSAVVSADTSTWSVAPTSRTSAIVAAAGGQFFHCTLGAGHLNWSLDGVNWNETTLVGASYLMDVAFGNGMYVAVDYEYRAYKSVDGHTWSSGVALPISDATASNPSRIVFGNGVFVIFGSVGRGVDSGKSMLLYSGDGVAWGANKQQCIGADSLYTSFEVAYGDGIFLASYAGSKIGGQPATCFYRSSNGADWTGGVALGNGGLSALGFGGGLFVGSTNNGLIGYSADSIQFDYVASGSDQPTRGGAFHAGKWIFPAHGTGTSPVPSVGRLLKCTLPPTFFADGFDAGDTCAWSQSLGGTSCLLAE